mgnify:CR=1 FL=1
MAVLVYHNSLGLLKPLVPLIPAINIGGVEGAGIGRLSALPTVRLWLAVCVPYPISTRLRTDRNRDPRDALSRVNDIGAASSFQPDLDPAKKPSPTFTISLAAVATLVGREQCCE